VELLGSLAAIIAFAVMCVALAYFVAPSCQSRATQRIEIGSVLLAGCARTTPPLGSGKSMGREWWN
jgi:hypothetical protein